MALCYFFGTRYEKRYYMEKSTDELMKILNSKKSYNEFFEEEVGELCFSSVADYLEVLLNEKHLKKSDVIRKSNLDKTMPTKFLTVTNSTHLAIKCLCSLSVWN